MKTLLTTTMVLGFVAAVSFSQPVAANSLGAGLTSQSTSQILLVRGGGSHGGGHFGGDVGHRDIGHGDVGHGAVGEHTAGDLAKHHNENQWRREENALGAENALDAGVDGGDGFGFGSGCFQDDYGNWIGCD